MRLGRYVLGTIVGSAIGVALFDAIPHPHQGPTLSVDRGETGMTFGAGTWTFPEPVSVPFSGPVTISNNMFYSMPKSWALFQQMRWRLYAWLRRY